VSANGTNNDLEFCIYSRLVLPNTRALYRCDFPTRAWTLRLRNNNLAGTIPPFLGIESLRTLDLSLNSIHGTIPVELSHLTYLEELILSDLVLTGSIPSEVGRMVRLRKSFEPYIIRFVVNTRINPHILMERIRNSGPQQQLIGINYSINVSKAEIM